MAGPGPDPARPGYRQRHHRPDPTPADLSAGLRTPGPPRPSTSPRDHRRRLVGNNSTQIWGDDVIELGIRVGSTTHQFTLAVNGRKTDNGSPIASLLVVTRTVPGGWALEVAVPATALGLSAPRGQPRIPFTFGLWDDDLRTYPGQTHMIWQGTDTNTYQPAWGTLSLSSTVYDFPTGATQTPTPTPTAFSYAIGTPTATSTIARPPRERRTPTPTPTVRRPPRLRGPDETTASTVGHTEASATPSPTLTPTPATGDIAGTVWLMRTAMGGAMPVSSGCRRRSRSRNGCSGHGSHRRRRRLPLRALTPGTYPVREVQPGWLRFSTTPDDVTVVSRRRRDAGRGLR